MRHFLSRFGYEGKDHDVVLRPDPRLVKRARDTVGGLSPTSWHNSGTCPLQVVD